MIKLNATDQPQTFPITTRDTLSSTLNVSLTYKREGEERENTVDASLTQMGYYTDATATFTDLIDGAVYVYSILDSDREIHRGEFVSTNQIDYSVNNNTYTSNTTDNDFIILD